MKVCPFCGGLGAVKHTFKGLPFVQCPALWCGAASKPAATEGEAIRNWETFVRAAERVPGEWMICEPIFSRAA